MMGCSRLNVGQIPLDEYVQVVASVYSPQDGHRSIWDVWCHTLHHAAGVAEQIRKGTPDENLYREIADFSMWLFTMVLKLRGVFGKSGGNFEAAHDKFIRIQSTCSDMLWHKYPKRCSFCHTRRVADDRSSDLIPSSPILCDCQAHQRESEKKEARRHRIIAMRRYSNEILDEKPTSIDGWQKMFGTIFAANLRALSPTEVALHVMEELGEVSDAMIRMYTYKEKDFLAGEPNWRQTNLEAQLADVFSWLFALIEKLDWLKQNGSENKEKGSEGTFQPAEPVRLSGIIWERYGSDELGSFFCPFCGRTVCSCKIVLVPATRLGEELVKRFQ